ncbi:MAG: histidinol dehydrogenase, partial [Clostridium sp.]
MIKIIRANSSDFKEHMESIKQRSEDVQKDINIVVDKILEDVKTRGDAAIIEYTQKFDSKCITKDNLIVSEEEIKNA